MGKFSSLLEHWLNAGKEQLNHFLNHDLLSQNFPSLTVPTKIISGKYLDFLDLFGEWWKKLE